MLTKIRISIDQRVVKFVVVKKREEDHAQPAELTSFEEAMLPI